MLSVFIASVRTNRPNNFRCSGKESGMTLLEMLAVVFLASIFIALILPQIYNVSEKARDSETKNSLAILRHGIAHAALKIQRHCAEDKLGFPPIANVRENDLAFKGSPCTEEDIPDNKDRRIFSQNLVPENYWGSGGVSRRIFSCRKGVSCMDNGNPKAGIDCVTGKPYTENSGGWCYDEKEGLLWANSAMSSGETTENLF